MEKKQIPKKHSAKKCTEEQEKEIKEIQDNMQKNRGDQPVAWLEAKHEFFEREERLKKYDQTQETAKGTVVQQIADTTEEPKKPKQTMTVEQTKIGVTMVLSKEDCKLMGFEPATTPTKRVIEVVRERLKLPSREDLKGGKAK